MLFDDLVTIQNNYALLVVSLVHFLFSARVLLNFVKFTAVSLEYRNEIEE